MEGGWGGMTGQGRVINKYKVPGNELSEASKLLQILILSFWLFIFLLIFEFHTSKNYLIVYNSTTGVLLQ